MDTTLLETTEEVEDALADGRPVVALESTLISHGLPYPQNLEVATASEEAVRASGARVDPLSLLAVLGKASASE